MQYDKDFLLQLDQQKNKVIYARITKLTFNELPLERIEGQVTGGSINVDGASAVRRTCSLTLLAQGFQSIDFYCGLNTKFKLEIGIKNNIDLLTYPEIIWFNQGIYIITSFSTSRSASNYTISISGKDKMCLLNGEVGGSIESAVDFGKLEEEDVYGNWTIKQIPIKDIIRHAVHAYGKEPYHNIIINDLEDLGVELMEYRYDTDLYIYRQTHLDTYENITFDETTPCKIEGTTSSTLGDLDVDVLENLAELTSDNKNYIVFTNGDTSKKYYVSKIGYGEACGYRLTDLTFAGELIANAGESITSILDKIKNMLVNFEYFYNVDGQFVFQKKPSVVSVMQNLDPTVDNKVSTNLIFDDDIYTFNGGEGLTSINNNPNLLNLRNDYSIWGERASISGATIPIHLRYAIDTKPSRYTTIYVSSTDSAVTEYSNKHNVVVTGSYPEEYRAGTRWTSGYEQVTLTSSTYKKNRYYYKNNGNDDDEEYKFDKNGTFSSSKTYYIYYHTCDWRELIYQMAADYYKYNFLEDFYNRIMNVNDNRYISGVTGYENYYTDIYSFWRQLYYPIRYEVSNLKELQTEIKSQVDAEETRKRSYEKAVKNARDDMKANASNKTGSAYKSAKTALSTAEKNLNISETKLEYLEGRYTGVTDKIKYLEEDQINYYASNVTGDDLTKRCWNKSVFETPYNLNFWFDFLNTNGILSQYSVKNIGSRPKVVTDNKVKVISYNKVPNIIYHKNLSNKKDKAGYRHIQVGSHYDNMFSISAQGKSAQDKLHELMDIHSFCVESVTINTVPIYYLQPNTRLCVSNKDSGASDLYVINKLTIPLAYNGLMSISATKIYDSLI